MLAREAIEVCPFLGVDGSAAADLASFSALDPAYRDPSLLGPEISDDAAVNDWMWSLVKTMRAGNDNEKLYPPGSFTRAFPLALC